MLVMREHCSLSSRACSPQGQKQQQHYNNSTRSDRRALACAGSITKASPQVHGPCRDSRAQLFIPIPRGAIEMNVGLKNQIALAVAAAIGASAMAMAPTAATAKTPGQYVAGDVHNHTTCSDGSISMQKLVKKATDKTDTPWGLDWFVQAGHGGNGNRNCTLVEDATLATPAYPFVSGMGPGTTWVNSGVTVKGDVSGSGASRNMWRWQSVQEIQYPLIEYLNAIKNLP